MTFASTWLSDISAGQQPVKGMVAVEEIGRLRETCVVDVLTHLRKVRPWAVACTKTDRYPVSLDTAVKDFRHQRT